MAFKDLFKNKKDKKDKKKEEKKVSNKKTKKKSKKKTKDFKGFAYKILKSPYITGKTLRLSGDNKYVFKVFNNVNKIEIKKAVKALYNVDVESVNIIKAPRKQRRVRGITGYRKGFKKAIVTVKKGQKIEELIQ